MLGIFSIFYIFLFGTAALASFFIVFHLFRYALDRRTASFAALLFIGVTLVLLATNAFLFFRLPFDTLLPLSGFSSLR